MTLEGKAQKIIKQMQAEGRIITLSEESSANIDRNLAIVSAQFRKEFQKKERASRAYVSDVESGRINLYKPNNLYKKIKNYFYNLFN